jgi:hypothetical protein
LELDASKNLWANQGWIDSIGHGAVGARTWSIGRRVSFFDLDDRLAELSVKGDSLERVQAMVDFEMFRAALEAAVPRADRSKGGRPAFDRMLMFKVFRRCTRCRTSARSS